MTKLKTLKDLNLQKNFFYIEKYLILALVRCLISIPVVIFYNSFGFDLITTIVGFVLIFWVLMKLYEMIVNYPSCKGEKRR